MKIRDFKSQFVLMSRANQLRATSEMEKADVRKNHCHGIAKEEIPKVIEAFKNLIEWTKQNTKKEIIF